MASLNAVALLQQHLRSLCPLLRQLTWQRCNDAPWVVEIRLDFVLPPPIHKTLTLNEIEEGLSLLALLHTLDGDAYAALMVEIWPSICSLGRRENDKHPLGVEMSFWGENGVIQLRSDNERRHQIGRSSTYQQVLQSVRDLPCYEDGWAPPRVPVSLTFSNPSFEQSMNLATQIHALYPNDDLAAIFEIKEARWSSAMPELGIGELQKMSPFESLGINFYVASLGSCAVPCEPEYRLPVLKTLRQQLVVPAAVHQETNVRGASSLTIPSRGRSSVAYPTPSYWVPALFSAAHSSVSLSHIVVDAPFADL